MKKIFYILSIALLGAAACSVNEIGQPEPMADNGKVTFVMGLQFPEVFIATRGAMAENPIIDDVHVAVFGSEGYLNDYVKAEPCDASGNVISKYGGTNGVQNGVLFYYKVTLIATTGSRTIHVIANGPDHLEFNKYDYDVMPNLFTEKGNGAYWTMFSLPNGTATVNPQTGAESASAEAIAAFSNLKLIRNFAKVTVTESANNFEMLGYEVFNTPDKGRIVTWMDGYNSSNERLAGYYTPYVGAKTDDPSTPADESKPKTFDELQTAGYTPSLVEGAIIDQTAPTAGGSYTNASKFVFERVKTNAANRPYIIIKGKYTDIEGTETTCFYRLDFTDKDGNYIPIFRNFQYNIEISSVAKVGVANPADAQPSNANVSALITTANLTDLADGTSRILVQYIDKTFIEAGDKKFQYIYMRDATKPIAQENVTNATFRILSNDELEAEGKQANTTDPAFTVSSTATDWGTSWNSAEKWQEVTLTIAAVGETEKRTTFRIEGQTGEGDKLYRDITIHVLAKQDFDAAYTSGGNAIGSTVTVNLTLPDNLPSSVFPLQIAFEDSNKRLNPNSTDMPAQVGTSIVTGKTDRSYQFVKSVSYDEYTTNHVIPCVFKRIATGATTLYMENEYFNKPYSINIGAN